MPPAAVPFRPDAGTIVRRSVEANERDWRAAPQFDYTNRSQERAATKTYDVQMLYGSPYNRLVAVNGHPLPPDQQRLEQEKLAETTARRRSESREKREARIAAYERDRTRDHLLMQQLIAAMSFTLLGQERIGPYQCYVLRAVPRSGYRPPNMQSQVLTGMRGKLWIDEASYQWVKVEASVVRPVYIDGFLARVEPGTRFELEKEPVADGVWLMSHFAMSARARILLLFAHHTQEEDWYSNYRKAATAGAPG